MTWNYRVIYHDNEEEPWYGIHEVYYDNEDNPQACTKNPTSITGETYSELQDDISKRIDSLRKPTLSISTFRREHQSD